jgi:hypothetical protein
MTMHDRGDERRSVGIPKLDTSKFEPSKEGLVAYMMMMGKNSCYT